MDIATLNTLIGVGAIVLQILAVSLLFVYFSRASSPEFKNIGDFFGRHGLWIGLMTTLGAVVFSLVHSHVFGLPPCDLCWWQRIFIYPQIVLFALAIWRKEASIAIYSIALSVIGALIAAYHHALQMFPHGMLPCPATGPSCAQILFLEFGYITYPMLALSIFGFLIVLMLFVRARA